MRQEGGRRGGGRQEAETRQEEEAEGKGGKKEKRLQEAESRAEGTKKQSVTSLPPVCHTEGKKNLVWFGFWFIFEG